MAIKYFNAKCSDCARVVSPYPLPVREEYVEIKKAYFELAMASFPPCAACGTGRCVVEVTDGVAVETPSLN